jgi:hypothetical protein
MGMEKVMLPGIVFLYCGLTVAAMIIAILTLIGIIHDEQDGGAKVVFAVAVVFVSLLISMGIWILLTFDMIHPPK